MGMGGMGQGGGRMGRQQVGNRTGYYHEKGVDLKTVAASGTRMGLHRPVSVILLEQVTEV